MRHFLTISLLLLTFTACAQRRHHFDAQYPDVHDPVMAQGEDGRYYVFSTGMGISVMSSSDLKTWQQEPGVFSVTAKMPDGKEFSSPGNAQLPTWTTDSVRGFHGHMWAPDISRHNGKWYLYYSCSTFGKNGSAIGVATNKTLDPKSPDFKWEDQGPVVVSHKHVDDWNAIDPNLASECKMEDGKWKVENGEYIPTGNSVLFWGSFWDGIQMAPLRADLRTLAAKPVTIARRYAPARNQKTADPSIEIVGNDTVEAGENAIEAPFVISHDGWYYLFVSWDYCCRGKNSTYKTVYGRSRTLTGPYLDKNGKDMRQGGGTILVGPDDKFFGVGHCSAYELTMPDGTTRQWYFLSHAYDISKDGQSKLFLRKLEFDKDGWLSLTIKVGSINSHR